MSKNNIYTGEDMIGDDGYGTWDIKRLDEEYLKCRKKIKEAIKIIKDKMDTTDCYCELCKVKSDQRFKALKPILDILTRRDNG